MNTIKEILSIICILCFAPTAHADTNVFETTNKVGIGIRCDGASIGQRRLSVTLRNNTDVSIIATTFYPLSFLEMRFFRYQDNKLEGDRLIWQSPPADWRPAWSKTKQVVLAPGAILEEDFLISSVMVRGRVTLEPGRYRLECRSRFSDLDAHDQTTAVIEFEVQPEPNRPQPSGVVHRSGEM
jgi:hypothetical protein